jgi:hypothetical protein
MDYMRKFRRTFIGIFLVLLCAFWIFGTNAWAGEKGKFRVHGALVTTNDKTIKIADKENHLVFFSEHDGVIFNDDGEGSFLDKARYQVVYLGDTDGMVDGGYKTFTMADGAQVFAKYQGTEASGAVFKGKWEFIGGTGKYKGITGQGLFTLTMISDTTAWDMLEGEYNIP